MLAPQPITLTSKLLSTVGKLTHTIRNIVARGIHWTHSLSLLSSPQKEVETSLPLLQLIFFFKFKNFISHDEFNK